MDSQTITALANSEVASTVAKKLWPTMLFLVVMSIIALLGAKWWSSSLDPISITISYWMWFIAMMTITAYGLYVFVLDARIQIANSGDIDPTS